MRASGRSARASRFRPDQIGLDIGPKSNGNDLIGNRNQDRTIVWNGPMGVFEIDEFARGTMKIANAVAENGADTSIVGGGDTVAAVKAAGVAEKITQSRPAAEHRWRLSRVRD